MRFIKTNSSKVGMIQAQVLMSDIWRRGTHKHPNSFICMCLNQTHDLYIIFGTNEIRHKKTLIRKNKHLLGKKNKHLLGQNNTYCKTMRFIKTNSSKVGMIQAQVLMSDIWRRGTHKHPNSFICMCLNQTHDIYIIFGTNEIRHKKTLIR